MIFIEQTESHCIKFASHKKKKKRFIAVSFCIVCSHSVSKECERQCPYIYRPVCTYNGVHYRMFVNACEMNAFNCDESKSI